MKLKLHVINWQVRGWESELRMGLGVAYLGWTTRLDKGGDEEAGKGGRRREVCSRQAGCCFTRHSRNMRLAQALS